MINMTSCFGTVEIEIEAQPSNEAARVGQVVVRLDKLAGVDGFFMWSLFHGKYGLDVKV